MVLNSNFEDTSNFSKPAYTNMIVSKLQDISLDRSQELKPINNKLRNKNFS
jgi:hypothetical protein